MVSVIHIFSVKGVRFIFTVSLVSFLCEIAQKDLSKMAASSKKKKYIFAGIISSHNVTLFAFNSCRDQVSTIPYL